MIETGAKSQERLVIGTAELSVSQGRYSVRDYTLCSWAWAGLGGGASESNRLLEPHSGAGCCLSTEFLMVPDQRPGGYRGSGHHSQSDGVSARFRTLIRNAAARSEGLEREEVILPGPWHGSRGWQIRGPGRTTDSHQAIGKESNKKVLDVNDGEVPGDRKERIEEGVRERPPLMLD